jgi:hypothetical protein
MPGMQWHRLSRGDAQPVRPGRKIYPAPWQELRRQRTDKRGRHASLESPRRAGVQSVPQRPASGSPPAGARSMKPSGFMSTAARTLATSTTSRFSWTRQRLKRGSRKMIRKAWLSNMRCWSEARRRRGRRRAAELDPSRQLPGLERAGRHARFGASAGARSRADIEIGGGDEPPARSSH